jgi:IMP cyclohydrolase
MDGLDFLRQAEIPGRFLLLQHVNGDMVGAYGLTGRSESSRARQLNFDTGSLMVGEHVQGSITKNRHLFLYPAIMWDSTEIPYLVVSNGVQTTPVFESKGPLMRTLAEPIHVRDDSGKYIDVSTYEPDDFSTPRISGIINPFMIETALCYRSGNFAPRTFTRFEAGSGEGIFLSTYDGVNQEGNTPLNRSQGPLPVNVPTTDPRELADVIWRAIAPKTTDKFRPADVSFAVGVATFKMAKEGGLEIATIDYRPQNGILVEHRDLRVSYTVR